MEQRAEASVDEAPLVAESAALRRLCDELHTHDVPDKRADAIFEEISSILELYQEQGSLLDPLLPELCQSLTSCSLRAHSGKSCRADHVVYVLCKVRGYKAVAKRMPHDVEYFAAVASQLLDTSAAREAWERRYVLLLWLSKLVMVPFPLRSLHSDPNFVDNLIAIAKTALCEPGRPAEAAAELLANLLARRDMASALEDTVLWCQANLEDPSSVNLLARILKRGDRHATAAALAGDIPKVGKVAIDSFRGSTNSLERLQLCKLVQRAAMLLLPPQLCSWRYKRGSRVLFQSTRPAAGDQDPQPPAGSTVNGHAAAAPAAEDPAVRGECAWWLRLSSDQVAFLEDAIDMLLQPLGDRDTIVRWSAAKGLGRITGRLPRVLAAEVCEAILAMVMDSAMDENRWHGSCLAFAELVRRGLVPPDDLLLESVVQFTVRGLQFDQRRAATSVGTQVRDAACFVCWAAARAYSPSDVDRFGRRLASGLVTVALFDREISCRRAASAALQECVGRFGPSAVPHGLDLLPLLDFYTVADAAANYGSRALEVASLGSDAFYLEPLIDELVERKLRHWDEHIRRMSAECLGRLVVVRDENNRDDVLGALAARALHGADAVEVHGAILGLAHCCPEGTDAPSPITDAIRRLVDGSSLVQRRGKAEQLLLEATCELVSSMATRHLLERNQLAAADVAFRALESPDEGVQRAAAAAVGSLAASDGPTRSSLIDRLSRSLDQPGFALAASFAPDASLAEPLGCAARTAAAPEARRNAALALVELSRSGALPVDAAMQILMDCAEDYAVDSRGDVGSWVREAAIRGLAQLIPKSGDGRLVDDAVRALVRQLYERIDRTRSEAARAIGTVTREDPRFRDAFGAIEDAVADPTTARIFQTAPGLFKHPYFGRQAVLGCAFSAAGMGYQAPLARRALEQFDGIETVLELYVRHRSDKRLHLPLLVCLEIVVGSNAPSDGAWSLQCANEVCADLTGCRDVPRILTAVRVLVLLSDQPKAAARCRRALVGMLGHPIPRVRRVVAEDLYTILILEEGEPSTLRALKIISGTTWECTDLSSLRALRAQLTELLLEPPVTA